MQGADLQVDYQSAAAAAQKSAQGVAAIRILEDLAPLMQIKADLADRIDEHGLLEVLMEARGAPAKMFRSREEADAIIAQRQQQQEALMAVQAAQAGAGALKDAAGAAAMMQPEQAA
jgi:hypothetical protein